MSAIEQRDGYRIVDRRGQAKPMAMGNGLYATPRNTQQQEFYRPRTWGINLKRAIEDYDWRELLEYSRQLVTQRGNLGWAVAQKNMYAVGDAWWPQYLGTNKKWGEELEEWLCDIWYPNCDVRGGVFDFQTNLWLTGMSMDVDGDDVMLPAVREDGFPLLKFCMAHEIGSAGDDGDIKGNGWDGAKVHNGIIVGANREFLGVRILNDDGEPSNIPALQCQLLFEPDWRNTDRGIPRVGKGILDWFDVEDIDVFLKRGVKLDASIGLLHYTESGEAPTPTDILTGRGTDGTDTGADPADVKFEKRLGGEIMYMRAGKGEKIEGFKGERPHPNSEAFVQRLERRGMLTIGWFHELLDPSKIGGASVRVIQDQARQSVIKRQKTLRVRARRALNFAVMQAQQAGFVSKNPDPDDQFKWTFGMPSQLTVDEGHDQDADREGLKLGTRTMAQICQKDGRWWEDVREQKKRENFNLIDCANELVAHSKGKLTLREAIDLMQQNNPNPRPDPETQPAKGPKKEEAK